jgi:uncharacterized Fe-S cluster-containing radical SAM superfamily protein
MSNQRKIIQSTTEINNHILQNEYNFENCIFECEVNFERFLFKKNKANFMNSVFKKKANFGYAEFEKEVWFMDTVFEDDVSFWDTKFKQDVCFNRSIFLKKADFLQAFFYKESDFNKVQFNSYADFYRVNFRGFVDFSFSKFNGITNFHCSSFMNENKISNKAHSEDFSFWNCVFGDVANFTEIHFNGSLSFEGALFEKYINFHNTHFNNLNLNFSIIQNQSCFSNVNVKNADIETYRVIKNEFAKINNRIEAIKYHQKEMQAYYVKLLSELFSKKKWKKLPSNLSDLFVLSLNAISNYFGSSWILGIVFTLSVAAIFFYFYLNSFNNFDYKIFWDNIWSFINPAHKIMTFGKDKIPSSAYFLDAVGRIFIGYGVFQTAQAFKKYIKGF